MLWGVALVAGAGARWSDVLRLVADRLPELGNLLELFGAPQIRNSATVGGNIANASPIADSLPFFYVTESRLELLGPQGPRSVAVEDFYRGYKETDLRKGELIASVGSLVSGLDRAVRGDPEGPLGQVMLQLVSLTSEVRGVVREAQGVVRQVQALAGEVQDVGGQAKTVLASIDGVVQRLDDVALNLTRVSDNLAVSTNEMRDPTGLIPRLLDPQGSVASFLDDDNLLFNRVDNALRFANRAVDAKPENPQAVAVRQ